MGSRPTLLCRLSAAAVLLVLALGAAAADIPAGYYDGTDGLSDTALILKLREITGAGYVSHSYDAARDEIFSTIDRQTDGTYICLYTGNVHTLASELNIEHVWPQSRGADAAPRESDCQHLYPVEFDINSRRGNLPFGWVLSPDYQINGSKVQYNVQFEPRDPVKGDVARAVFYFAMRYNYPLVNTGYVLGTSEDKMGFEDVLRQWHAQDPVTDTERARNDRVYTYQHNRNPFVDHPEFVGRIATFGEQATPTATPTASPTPTQGAVEFDLSGYTVRQFNSTQSYTFAAGTKIKAGSSLVLARWTDRVGIEQAWSISLPADVVVINSNETCPMINGQETYELVDPGELVIDGPTQTSGLNALSGNVAVRATTDSNAWSVVSGTQSPPGSGSYPLRNAGVVITKFGESPSGYVAEFVELYFDAASGPTPTPTPSPTPIGSGGNGWMLY